MDISKTTDIKELKAMVYDELVKKEQAERNIVLINQRIVELENTPHLSKEDEPKSKNAIP